MPVEILIFLTGIAALTYGANMLVVNSSKIAVHFNIRPFIIGATIIAFGTSTPELVVSLAAVIKGTKSIALGNIIGSNIANIGLILGFTAMLSPMDVDDTVLTKDIPIMIIATGVLYIMSLDGLISRIDGAILLIGIVLFTYYCIRSNNSSKKNNDTTDAVRNGDFVPKAAMLCLAGLVMLIGGAHFMVGSAVKIARVLGISEIFIGLTMVAVGTSLPELAASTAAIIKKESDMSIGNIVGSNIFNILLVLGLVTVIKPISVDKSLLFFEYPVMAGFAALLYILGRTGKKFSKADGALLLILYIIFIALLYMHSAKIDSTSLLTKCFA